MKPQRKQIEGMQVHVDEIAYHRNGVSGDGFHVCLFHTTGDEKTAGRKMMAVLFQETSQCAVLDATETANGNIGFAQGNSWRGDHFETQLREAIKRASNRH